MTTDQARAKSKALWDEMATGWERKRAYLWEASRQVGEWLVEEAGVKPGDTVLEVGGGPGDTGFVAAQLVGDEGTLIETDFSPEMVEVARRRGDELGLENVDYRVMDAENMDLGDDSVDAIVARWAYMLMLDPTQALKESRRVLRDGGKVAFSVWGGPADNPWITIPGMTIRNLGHEMGGDPFAPGGIFSMADHEVIRKMLNDAGFKNATIEDIQVHWTTRNFDESWDFMTNVAGPISMILKVLPDDAIAELQDALKQAFAPFKKGEGYSVPGVTLNVAAF